MKTIFCNFFVLCIHSYLSQGLQLLARQLQEFPRLSSWPNILTFCIYILREQIPFQSVKYYHKYGYLQEPNFLLFLQFGTSPDLKSILPNLKSNVAEKQNIPFPLRQHPFPVSLSLLVTSTSQPSRLLTLSSFLTVIPLRNFGQTNHKTDGPSLEHILHEWLLQFARKFSC